MDNVSLTIEELLINAKLFAGDSTDEHTGVMIAFFLDPDVAGQLSTIRGVATTPDQLHLTLAYLGSRDTLTDAQIASAILATQSMARMHEPLVGTINGVGRFNASQSTDGQDVIYAVVDVPGLSEFRQGFNGVLGINDPPPLNRTHDFNPHVTLAYIEAGSDSPIAKVPTIPLRLGALSIVVGGRRVDFPLSGSFRPIGNEATDTVVEQEIPIVDESPNETPATPVAEVIPDGDTKTPEPVQPEVIDTVVVPAPTEPGADQLIIDNGTVVGGVIDLAINTKLVRTERRKGKEYLVAPTVAIREGVLNGEYVPANEIEKFALAWNGRPVPLGHPKDDVGAISANTPDLWDVTPAYFWNAQADNGTLTGEIWFDVAKAHDIGGLAIQAETLLRAGAPMEVSTAYFRDLERGAGTYNGKEYRGTARNLRPDHIALLLDEPGACSWQDGCGAPRTNSANEVATGSFIAAGVRKLQELVNPNTRRNAVQRDELIGALVANAACKCTKEQLDGMEDATLQAIHDSIPVANSDTPETPAPVETVVVTPVVPAVVPLPQEVTQFAELIQALGGIDKVQSTLGAMVANSDRERTDLVARIAANQRNVLTKEELDALTIESLRKLNSSFGTRNYAGNAGTVATNARQGEDEYEVLAMPTIAQGGK